MNEHLRISVPCKTQSLQPSFASIVLHRFLSIQHYRHTKHPDLPRGGVPNRCTWTGLPYLVADDKNPEHLVCESAQDEPTFRFETLESEGLSSTILTAVSVDKPTIVAALCRIGLHDCRKVLRIWARLNQASCRVLPIGEVTKMVGNERCHELKIPSTLSWHPPFRGLRNRLLVTNLPLSRFTF